MTSFNLAHTKRPEDRTTGICGDDEEQITWESELDTCQDWAVQKGLTEYQGSTHGLRRWSFDEISRSHHSRFVLFNVN